MCRSSESCVYCVRERGHPSWTDLWGGEGTAGKVNVSPNLSEAHIYSASKSPVTMLSDLAAFFFCSRWHLWYICQRSTGQATRHAAQQYHLTDSLSLWLKFILFPKSSDKFQHLEEVPLSNSTSSTAPNKEKIYIIILAFISHQSFLIFQTTSTTHCFYVFEDALISQAPWTTLCLFVLTRPAPDWRPPKLLADSVFAGQLMSGQLNHHITCVFSRNSPNLPRPWNYTHWLCVFLENAAIIKATPNTQAACVFSGHALISQAITTTHYLCALRLLWSSCISSSCLLRHWFEATSQLDPPT